MDDGFLTYVLNQLREQAIEGLTHTMEEASERFKDIVGCWAELEKGDGVVSDNEGFAHITSVLIEKCDIDPRDTGVMMAMTTMVMGAKMYHEATKVNNEV